MLDRIMVFVVFPMLVALGVFAVYAMFVLTPVSMYTDAECLRKGYPKSYVTIGLERYCSTLDGAVTIKVDKQ